MKDEDDFSCKDPVSRILEQAMGNLKSIIDVDTVMGDPVGLEDGSVIIPITKVSVGFVAGGGEYTVPCNHKKSAGYPFSGGSGAGFSVKPIGFLVGKSGTFQLISIQEEPAYKKLAEIMSDLAKTYLKSQTKSNVAESKAKEEIAKNNSGDDK